MGNKIIIKEGDKVITELDSDTPSLEALKKYVLDNRLIIQVDKITSSCETDNFDVNIFNDAIKEAIKTELNELKLHEDNLNNFLKEIEKNK